MKIFCWLRIFYSLYRKIQQRSVVMVVRPTTNITQYPYLVSVTLSSDETAAGVLLSLLSVISLISGVVCLLLSVSGDNSLLRSDRESFFRKSLNCCVFKDCWTHKSGKQTMWDFFMHHAFWCNNDLYKMWQTGLPSIWKNSLMSSTAALSNLVLHTRLLNTGQQRTR